ncbi:MAG: hypothetical protein U0230_18090 [Polyangiales bacterium]
MRLGAYFGLVNLAVIAAMSGHLGIALALGGAKAAIVGSEFMELRHANRAHAIGYMVLVTLVVLGLLLRTPG